MPSETKKKRKKKNSKKKKTFSEKLKTAEKNYKKLSEKYKKRIKGICVALSVIMLAAVVAVAAALGNANNSDFEFASDKSRVSGIDVSSHNGNIDWSVVKENVDFAFIRVGVRGYSKGEINGDKKASYNLKHAAKNSVPVGVYIFSQAVTEKEAVEEAQFALSKIKRFDVSLPVVIDFEYASDSKGNLCGRLKDANLTKNEAADIINAFCKTVSDAGYTPGVYASTYFYESKINTQALSDDIVIWVADYNKKITYDGDYDIWQYSNTGSCGGVSSKYVDRNYWYTDN